MEDLKNQYLRWDWNTYVALYQRVTTTALKIPFMFCHVLRRMTRRNKLIWLQIILGVAFLLQPIFLPVRPDNLDQVVFSREVVKNILANAFIIVFFYLNFFLLIPKFYFTKKYIPYFLIVFSCLLITLFISTSFTQQFPDSRSLNANPPPRTETNFPPPHFEHDRKPSHQHSVIAQFRFFFTENDQIFFLFGSIVLFSLFLQISNRYYKTENAKQEAEINYLLAQINPHFLFNALNSIYTLAIKEKAKNASESLLKLSGLMRYVITETNQNLVPLEKE